MPALALAATPASSRPRRERAASYRSPSDWSIPRTRSQFGIIFICGIFVEQTEGPTRVALILIGSQCIGVGMQFVMKHSSMPLGVTGASGAAYGILWSSISLLILNWHERPLRWLQLALMLVIFAADVAQVVLDLTDGKPTAMGHRAPRTHHAHTHSFTHAHRRAHTRAYTHTHTRTHSRTCRLIHWLVHAKDGCK